MYAAVGSGHAPSSDVISIIRTRGKGYPRSLTRRFLFFLFFFFFYPCLILLLRPATTASAPRKQNLLPKSACAIPPSPSPPSFFFFFSLNQPHQPQPQDKPKQPPGRQRNKRKCQPHIAPPNTRPVGTSKRGRSFPPAPPGGASGRRLWG